MKAFPAATSTTPVDSPVTATGVAIADGAVWFPSCPEVLSPQHSSPPP